MKKNMLSKLAILAVTAASLVGCSKDSSIGNHNPETASQNSVRPGNQSAALPSGKTAIANMNQDINSGSVAGIVFPVPKIGEIQIFDLQGNLAGDAKTNATGAFAVDKMLPGTYVVVIRYLSNKKGQPVYKTKKITNVVVQEGQTTNLGFIMAI